MKKLIRCLNDSKLLSFLCTPWRIKRFYRTYQRVRMCEECGYIGKNVHWSKDDQVKDKTMVYGHKWLCDNCFYPDIIEIYKWI